MIRLRIFDGSPYFMSQFADSDGAVYLDLNKDFKINFSKEIEQQTSINKINIEALLGTSLPVTPKNEALIGKPTGLSIKGNDYPDFKVQLMIGFKIFNQSQLRILGKKETDKGEEYEIEIIDTTNHWAVKLSEIYLDELPFAKVDYTPANLLNSMNLDAHYDNGDNGIYFPLVNYGLWTGDDYFTVSDFRPWVHALKVLQLAFTKAEWALSCPLLETEVGRRIITYVLKENFHEDEGLKKSRQFKVAMKNKFKFPNVTGKKPSYLIVPFDQEIEDPGNNYDPITGAYTGTGYAEFFAEIYMDATWDDLRFGGARFSIQFSLIQEYADGSKHEIDKAEAKYEHFREDNWRMTVTGSIFVKPGEKVYIEWRGDGHGPNDVRIRPSSTFYCKPIQYIAQEGDSFDVQKALRHDKVIDYLKGIDHLFNFKYYTSFTEKKVYILTPYDMSFFGDSISGFFQTTLEDWTDYIDISNSDIKVPHDEKKNLYFKFKKSSDPTIEDLKLDEDKELFSNFIDKGLDFKDDTEKFENPYFEPTLNSIVSGQGADKPLYDIPYLLDNKDGKLSFNIAPRIAIAAGMTEQLSPKNPYLEINYFNYIHMPTIPYAYQFGNAYVSVTGTRPSEVYELPTNYLVYGKQEFDLFNLFYKKYFNEFRNCQKITLDSFANYDKIESIDFRKRILINHNGSGQVGRFLSVDGYDVEQGIGKILFKADNTSDPNCNTYTPVNQCNNYPEILVTPTGGGNYSIAPSGTNVSPVTTMVTEWKYFDQTTWTNGTSFNTTDKKVYARITWTYSDGCPSIQKIGAIEPCGNYPKLCYEKILPDLTLSVYECGTHSDTITGYLYEFSINNGTSWEQIYDPFYLADLPEIVYLRVTVYYTNCPPTQATTIYQNASNDADCTYDGLYVPTVIFVQTGAGLMLERKGAISGKIAVDIIWFREKGSTDEWALYDDKNPEILDTGSGISYEAKRVILFCNNDCPAYCSDIVTAKEYCPESVIIDKASSTCNYDLKWENPDTPGSNTWKTTLLDDTSDLTGTLRVWLKQDCGGTITELYERTSQWGVHSFKTEFAWTWAQGDTVNYLRISKNVAGTQTLNLNCNVGVVFNSGMTNDELKSELENAIITNMYSTHGAINNIHFDLIVTVTGTGSNRTTSVAFVSKKVVTSTWYGPNKGTDYLRTTTPGNVTTDRVSTGVEFQKVPTSAPISQRTTPCGTLLKAKLKVNTSTKFINDSSSNFDNIVVNTSIAVDSEVLTVITSSCTRHELTPSVTGCTSATFLWKRGNLVISEDIFPVVYGDRKVDLFVTCIDGCTYTASILG